MILTYLRKLLKPKYPTLNRLEILSSAIGHNLHYLKSLQPQATIIPVLKSNAYGHGLKEMCQIMNRQGIGMIALDSFPEAQVAYRYFKGDVLLLGEMPLLAYRHLDWKRTQVCVYNSETLRHIASLGVKAKIHLFVNSGMNREGIKDLPSFWQDHLDCWPKVEITGLCSHLADAEGDGTLNQIQLQHFFRDLDYLAANSIVPRWVHLGNSASVFILHDPRLTAFRPGIAVYGYNPFSPDSDHFELAQQLQPALRVVSTVVSVQELQPGEPVSYNAAFRAPAETRIAVIPFGYYEGLDRRLSNLADFQLVKGREVLAAKLAGKVCMNLACLDVGREADVKAGDEVILISDRRSDPNSLENLAHLQGTIPYEVLVKFQANIRRNII